MKKLSVLRAFLCAALGATVLCGCVGSGGENKNTPEISLPAIELPALPSPAATVPPAPTMSPEPEPTPSPEPTPEAKNSWTLCFAGDCTIGTLHEWQGSAAENNMLWVMGGDLAYPFSRVSGVLSGADFTMVNLEGTFTNSSAAKSKNYRFRSPPEYAGCLVLGGVDAVSLANNHTGDYLAAGYEDTCLALDAAGILRCNENEPLITELEGGLSLGIVAFNTVEIDLSVGDVEGYLGRIGPMYDYCAEKCDVVIAFMHWGWEYTPGPEGWMVRLAHAMADMGFDLIVGSHAHVLQETEYYNGVPIFYSLGNFCYGGNSDPDDKDSVIVRQHIYRDALGGIVVGETEFLPCSISGSTARNDFCPRLFEEGSGDFRRVMEKLKAAEFYADVPQHKAG